MSYYSSFGKGGQLFIILLIVTFVCQVEEVRGAKRFFRNRLSGEELKKPFVLLYEHESFRGMHYAHPISKNISIPELIKEQQNFKKNLLFQARNMCSTSLSPVLTCQTTIRTGHLPSTLIELVPQFAFLKTALDLVTMCTPTKV